MEQLRTINKRLEDEVSRLNEELEAERGNKEKVNFPKKISRPIISVFE